MLNIPSGGTKRQLDLVKVRNRGLAENTKQIVAFFAFANLTLARNQLSPLVGAARLPQPAHAVCQTRWRQTHLGVAEDAATVESLTDDADVADALLEVVRATFGR